MRFEVWVSGAQGLVSARVIVRDLVGLVMAYAQPTLCEVVQALLPEESADESDEDNHEDDDEDDDEEDGDEDDAAGEVGAASA